MKPVPFLSLVVLWGCTGSTTRVRDDGAAGAGGSGGSGAMAGAGGQGGAGGTGGQGNEGGAVAPDDPTTCEQAAERRSYVGCDFWPTALASWASNGGPGKSFAAIVANTGSGDAEVNVTGPAGTNITEIVKPGTLVKIRLPWVADLQAITPVSSVKSPRGAYHLLSTRPVTVYQFNALENSATNDASLLIPTTAMTGNYWVTAAPPSTVASYFGITATEDGTDVKVVLGPAAATLAGIVPATMGGATAMFKLDAGDVAQIVTTAWDYKAKPPVATGDFAGTQVTTSRPVQVIAGTPCSNMPNDSASCDHLEEIVLPVETLGQRYHVTVPTGPEGKAVAHIVRLFGVADGTTLAYAPAAPPGAPTTLAAGQMVDLRIVREDFEVTGNKAFAVGSFMVSKQVLYPGATSANGDPSQTTFAAVEQYRKGYVFLTPDDYPISFADVVGPVDGVLTLDGAPVTVAAIPIGASGWGVHRIKLGSGTGGVHVLTATKPVGLQIIGYDIDTSYQYPGGLNLRKLGTAGP